jgi:hypothetical protein
MARKKKSALDRVDETLDTARAAFRVVSVADEVRNRFSVAVVNTDELGAVLNFSATLLPTRGMLHFQSAEVSFGDLAKIIPGAKFWRIEATESTAQGVRCRCLRVIFED